METFRSALTPPRRRIAVLLVVVAVLLLLPLPRANRAMHALYDLGHAPLFGVLSVMLFWWGRKKLPRNDLIAAILVWGTVAILGIATEYVQGFLGRHPSWQDVAANLLGSAAFLIWAISWNWRYRVMRIAAFAIGVACLVAAWRAPAIELADTLIQQRELPMLGSFERRLEFSRWQWSGENCELGQAKRWASDGEMSMAIKFKPARYPSFSLYWPVEDWSPYQALTFDILLTGAEPLPLIVKIEDVDHNGETNDRFHRAILLQPGLNSPRIRLADVAIAPHGRTLDLRRIKRMQFYTVDLQTPRVLFLDNVRLIP